MEGNDISNGSPVRYLVAYNLLQKEETVVEKKRFRKPVETTVVVHDELMLSALWRFQDRMNCVLELVVFGRTRFSDNDAEKIFEDLDSLAVNPFRSALSFRSPAELVKQLLYMPNVIGVIDTPNMALVYGSKYFDLSRVMAL